MDIMLCGDFDLLKKLFNHPDLQDRLSKNLPAFSHQSREERMVTDGVEMPGVGYGLCFCID